MKALFIGGTGTISTAVTALAREKGWEVTLLNRGSKPVPEEMCIRDRIDGTHHLHKIA